MNDSLTRIVSTFEEHSGLHGIDYEVRERADGDVLNPAGGAPNRTSLLYSRKRQAPSRFE